MATITVRLDDTTKTHLDDLARAQGVTLSDLVRSTLEHLVAYPEGAPEETLDRQSVAPRSLSPVERQILALQHRILAHVMPADHGDAPTRDCARVEGDPQCQRQRAQILEGGYVGEYPSVFISTEPELTAEESELVLDLLHMFRVVVHSIQRLRGAGIEIDEDLERRLSFHGFDVQRPDEVRLLRYAEYLISDERWPELKPALGEDNDYGNSHTPMRGRYERLLAEYRRIRDQRQASTRIDSYLLTLEQLEQLDAARVHPDSPEGHRRRAETTQDPAVPTPSRKW